MSLLFSSLGRRGQHNCSSWCERTAHIEDVKRTVQANCWLAPVLQHSRLSLFKSALSQLFIVTYNCNLPYAIVWKSCVMARPKCQLCKVCRPSRLILCVGCRLGVGSGCCAVGAAMGAQWAVCLMCFGEWSFLPPRPAPSETAEQGHLEPEPEPC